MGRKTNVQVDKGAKKKIIAKASSKKDQARAVLLLKLAGINNRIATWRKIEALPNVVTCETIKGDYDLVVLLQSDTVATLEETTVKTIKNIPEIQDCVFMPVQSTQQMKKTADLQQNKAAFTGASAYVFLEVEREKVEKNCSTLTALEQVFICEHVTGLFDIVLLMQETDFAAIERRVDSAIKPLEGVLRIKKAPVIKLFEIEAKINIR